MDDARAWYISGMSLQAENQPQEALLDRKRKIPHDLSLVWYSTGLSLYQNHRKEEAIGAFQRVLAIDPAVPAAGITLGWPLADLGRLPEALEAYGHATRSDSANKPYWNNKGLVHRRLGQADAAISSFQTALGIDKNTSMAGTTLVLCYSICTGIPRLKGLLVPHSRSNPVTHAPLTENTTRNSKQVSPDLWKWCSVIPFLQCEYGFFRFGIPLYGNTDTFS